MIDLFRNLLFRDFWLKLLSVVFAVIIWMSVSKLFLRREGLPLRSFATHNIEQVYRELPILVRVPASEARAVTVDPSTVEVTVSGDPKAVRELRRESIRVEVDLTGISSARSLRKRIEVTLPNGLVASRVNPSDVEVILSSQ